MPRFLPAVLLLTALAGPADAYSIVGQVVAVLDGDTIDVLDANKNLHRVRLSAIDAPERRQPYGARAKQALSAHISGRQVRAVCHRREVRPESGRVRHLCTVQAPQGGNVNLQLVAAGMAWHYTRYAREQSPADRSAYAAAEARARAARAGLWHDQAPIAPWTWRHEIRAAERR